MVENEKEIYDLFRFDEDLCRRYKYLNSYTELFDKWYRENIMDNEILVRYMLIGFFFTYRACVHTGTNFNTQIEKKANKNKYEIEHDKKSLIYNRITGKPICTTSEYVELVKVREFSGINGEKLFNFVTTGDVT